MSKHVRIWEPIHKAYKECAEENGLILSNFVSILLIECANNPAIVESAVAKFFNVKRPEKVAFSLLAKISEARRYSKIRKRRRKKR